MAPAGDSGVTACVTRIFSCSSGTRPHPSAARMPEACSAAWLLVLNLNLSGRRLWMKTSQ
jgi:hypothetical protein